MFRPRWFVWGFLLACTGGQQVNHPTPTLHFLPLPPAPPAIEAVTLTAYSSEVSQTDSTPFITASGTRTRQGVIALSRDLLARYPYGTKARIISHACGLDVSYTLVVEDTMHRRKRRQVDIWMPSRAQALQWGRCTGWVKFE
jgi:3D (Asp-Asp-Asp) domain-containing protein